MKQNIINVKLDKNNHSVFLLYFHLVLVVKYRRNVIDENISIFLKEIFEKVQNKYGIKMEEWNHDKNHIHVLFCGSPNTEISKFINLYKSVSSRLIKLNFIKIKKQLWKEFFWSRGFCLITSGGAPIEIIKKVHRKSGK